jgi:hypothetical protein
MLIAPHAGGGGPYLRMWRGERPLVSTANDSGHRGKGDRPIVPSRRRQGCGGRTLPPSLNPQERTMKRRMKMERRGR